MTLATGEKFSQPALGTVQEEVKGIQEPLLCLRESITKAQKLQWDAGGSILGCS